MSKGYNTKLLLGLLLLSLALNIGLVGFLVGKHSGLGPMHKSAMVPPSAALSRFMRELDEPRRDELRPLFRSHIKTLRPGAKAMRQGQQELRSALVSQPLDTAALTTALQSIAQLPGQRAPAIEGSFVAFVQGLTLDERQQLASKLSRSKRHPARRSHREP